MLLLGRGVASSFGLMRQPYLEPVDHFDARYVVVPHPSGLNHWWNDAGDRERARRVLRGIVDELRQQKAAA